MKYAKLVVSLVVLVVLAGLAVWAYRRVGFNFAEFRSQLSMVNWIKIAIGIGCIYLGYILRSVRWALFLKPSKPVSALALLDTQVIGFTAVALLGRPADLVRPYLVTRKTDLSLSSQFAVYVVERMFDLGSMTLIFSTAILLAAHEVLPHPELLQRVAKGGLIVTGGLAVFTVAVRLAGGAVAASLEKTLGVFSKNLGHSVGTKIRAFREGLNTLKTTADLGLAIFLSLAMWGLITFAYLETTQAFVASPPLAHMTLAKCMVLMASSLVASGVSLPVIGWFTQIGIVEEALRNFFGVAPESATACAAMLLTVTFLSIVPIGVVWAQFSKVSLRKIAVDSEQAGAVAKEQLAEEPSEA